MLPVADARTKILDRFEPLPPETVSLAEGAGRVLAESLVSRRTQPARDVSAMDGYAVRSEDVAQVPVTLRQIGAAPAGHGFDGTVGPGETVRIFTGAPVPAGADTIVIQENAEADGDRITVNDAAKAGAFVRPAGLDFAEGQSLLAAGVRLGTRELGLAHGISFARVSVRDQSSRWGSCSSRGNLSLNWRLILLRPNLQDHIIYHELAHLSEMNHSEAFWRLLNHYDPRTGHHNAQLNPAAARLMPLGRG